MKLLYFFIKRICIGIFSIYSVNILFRLINLSIPINLFTISISSFLGVFGIISLFLLIFLI